MYDVYANGESIYDPTNSSLYLFSPKVKVEFGKAGSFEFVIPPSNVYYDSLSQMKTIITVEDDAGVEIFRGRILNISRDFNNLKTVYCEGDLAYLVDSVQKGEKYDGTTHALFRKIIQKHNSMVEANKRFTVGNITIDNRPVKITGKSEEADNTGNIDYKQIALDSIADNWNSSYDCIQNWIIDYCGGYLQTRRVGNTTYLDLLKNHDNAIDAKVTFGVNMLDLTEEANIEDDEFFTVLIPLGDENLTIKTVNNNSEELVNTDLVKRYGRIVRTHVFSNVNQASTLLEDAKRYMAFNKEPPVTVTVKAIDMHFIDSDETPIYVGDYVKIKSAPHDVSRRLVCTEIEYDLINVENTAYTFGNPKQTLTRRYKEDKRKSNDTNSAGSAGGGAATAAGAANWKLREDSDKDTDDKLQKAYDAWFETDPDKGTGRFGGLYREFEGVKTVLERQVGINFDAEQGNVNLYSVTERINQISGEQETARADFNAWTGVVDGRLTAITEMQSSYKTDTDTKIASINTWANEIESGISAKADKVEITALQASIGGTITDVDKMKNVLTKQVGLNFDVESGNINLSSLNRKVNEQGNLISEHSASISTVTSNLQSQISLEASHHDETKDALARIRITADNLGSRIDLKADTFTVEANLTDIRGQLRVAKADIERLKVTSMTAEQIAAKIAGIERLGVMNLYASSITSPSIMISSDGSTSPAATVAGLNSYLNSIKSGDGPGLHYHEVDVNDTTGIITLGKPTSSPRSFNIRATKTYRDGVAAAAAAATVTIDQISVSRNDAVYPDGEWYNSGTHNTTLYVNASVTNSNGTVVTKPWSFVVSGNAAYQAGLTAGSGSAAEAIEEAVNNVRVTRITKTESYNSITHDTAVNPTAHIDSNGNTYTPENPWIISGENAFNAGVQSVRTIRIEPHINSIYGASEHYNPSTGTTTIYVKATAVENSNFNTAYFVTSTSAFDDGKTKGATEATAKAIRDLVVNVATGTNKTYTSNSGAGYYTVYMDASAKIGDTTKTNSNGSYTFVATDAYNAGKDAGGNSLILSTPVLNSTQTGWQIIDGVWRYPYRISATASAERSTSTNSITVYSPSSSGWSYINGNKPYNEGKKEAEPKSVTLSVDDTTFSTSALTMKGTAKVKLGDNSISEFPNVSIDASKPWNSVTMSDFGMSSKYNSQYTTITISGEDNAKYSSKNMYGCVKISLLNGKTYNRRIKIDATLAYNAGKKKGEEAVSNVSISDVSGLTYNKNYTVVNAYNSKYSSYEGGSNHIVGGSIKVKLSNGASGTYRVRFNGGGAYEAGVKSVDTSDAWNQGYNAASIASIVKTHGYGGNQRILLITLNSGSQARYDFDQLPWID